MEIHVYASDSSASTYTSAQKYFCVTAIATQKDKTKNLCEQPGEKMK